MRPKACTCRPHAFKAVYTVTLHGEKLRTDLRVLNTGDAPLSFTGALHSYFEVLDVGVARITGLSGLTYLDKVIRSSANRITTIYDLHAVVRNPQQKLEGQDIRKAGDGAYAS